MLALTVTVAVPPCAPKFRTPVLGITDGDGVWVTVIFLEVLPEETVSTVWRSIASVLASIERLISVGVFLRPPDGKHLHHEASEVILQSAFALTEIFVLVVSFVTSILSGETLITTS